MEGSRHYVHDKLKVDLSSHPPPHSKTPISLPLQISIFIVCTDRLEQRRVCLARSLRRDAYKHETVR